MSQDSFHPWLEIWIRPRATIARIIAENPNRGLWWLAAIYGFSALLNSFQSAYLGRQMGLIPIFAIAVIISPIWGYVSFSIWSWVVSFTGKWLKGEGTFKEVRAAYAWSCTPLIVNVILWIALGLFFGRDLFMNIREGYPFTQGEVTMLFFVLLARIGAAIWSIVIYLNALAQVQRFTILRTIGNVFLSAVIIAVVFFAIALIVGNFANSQMSFIQIFY